VSSVAMKNRSVVMGAHRIIRVGRAHRTITAGRGAQDMIAVGAHEKVAP